MPQPSLWRTRSSAVARWTASQTDCACTPRSSCFIASAAYGSPLAQQVSVLRRLRDRQLLALAPGRPLVAAYYAWSPAAAAYVAERPWLRGLVRALLRPLTAAAAQLP